VATPMIPRNTTIPASKTEIFSTAADNQTQVQIVITQGERPMSRDNKQLGTFVLDGIPPAPRGVPQIEVTFDIDSNGILKVTAKDKATEKTQNITITGAVGLSDEEIEKMREEAEKHKEEDEKKKALVDAKNGAEQIVNAAEKAIKDAGDKAPKDIVESVEEKIKAVKEVKDGEDKDKIEEATKALSEELQKVGQQMYEAASKDEAKPEGEASEEKSDE